MERQPAKTLADIDIPEGVYKPDFELTDRYQAFSEELLRLSLLGVAGYGFLISEVVMKRLGDGTNPSHTPLLSPYTLPFLALGVIALGVSAAFALAYRFRSTSCLSRQLSIARTLKRLENPHWTEAELQGDGERLEKERADQRQILHTCHHCLRISTVSLVVGTIFTVSAFAVELLR